MRPRALWQRHSRRPRGPRRAVRRRSGTRRRLRPRGPGRRSRARRCATPSAGRCSTRLRGRARWRSSARWWRARTGGARRLGRCCCRSRRPLRAGGRRGGRGSPEARVRGRRGAAYETFVLAPRGAKRTRWLPSSNGTGRAEATTSTAPTGSVVDTRGAASHGPSHRRHRRGGSRRAPSYRRNRTRRPAGRRGARAVHLSRGCSSGA